MAHLIDKDALVAEIEKLKETYSKCLTRNDYEDGLKEGRLIGYEDALHKISTFEVKEVDLWTELGNYIEHYRNRETGYTMFGIAKHFFELGLKAQKGE